MAIFPRFLHSVNNRGTTCSAFSFLKNTLFLTISTGTRATCVEGGQIYVEMLEHFGDAPAKVRRLRDAEHRADEITHHTVEMLHKSFITPIARDQIHQLSSLMDDVIDLIDGSARRTDLYGVKENSIGPVGTGEGSASFHFRTSKSGKKPQKFKKRQGNFVGLR